MGIYSETNNILLVLACLELDGRGLHTPLGLPLDQYLFEML